MRRLVAVVALSLVQVVSVGARAAGSCGVGGETGKEKPVSFLGSVYYVTTPPSYDPTKPWPLVLGLHGDEGDPQGTVNAYWRDVADDSFIFVAPKAPNEGGSWYRATRDNAEWMDGLLASLRASYNIDEDRIYVWGMSGGAIFLADYALDRQTTYAAVEFNMGSANRYSRPDRPECRIPARFAASPTDYLLEKAQNHYERMTAKEHETQWVDAGCDGHCFDPATMGATARDWLLSHTLCGARPTGGCRDADGGTLDAGRFDAGGRDGGLGGAAGGSGQDAAAAGDSNAGASGRGDDGAADGDTSDGLRLRDGANERGDAAVADEAESSCGCSTASPRLPSAATWLGFGIAMVGFGWRRRRASKGTT